MFSATLREWKRKIEQLRQRWRAVRQENERLRKENEVLRRREKQWERERERLREENDRLRQQLEEAQRANKRQAAPFSRGTRKEHPKTPGRKPGAAYGRRYCKLPPKQVDEIVPVPLPRRCSCRGRVVFDRTESQYQQEIVRKTIWRRFDIDIGHCEKCHKRVQGRDSRQTSDALGAAKVQLGPEALALAVRLNTDLAMPHADVAAVLRDGFGSRRTLPAAGARGVQASPGLGRALQEQGDLPARIVDRDGTSGSQARSRVEQPGPGSGQPQVPEPSRSRATLPLYLPLLSWAGCHEQCQ